MSLIEFANPKRQFLSYHFAYQFEENEK